MGSKGLPQSESLQIRLMTGTVTAFPSPCQAVFRFALWKSWLLGYGEGENSRRAIPPQKRKQKHRSTTTTKTTTKPTWWCCRRSLPLEESQKHHRGKMEARQKRAPISVKHRSTGACLRSGKAIRGPQIRRGDAGGKPGGANKNAKAKTWANAPGVTSLVPAALCGFPARRRRRARTWLGGNFEGNDSHGSECSRMAWGCDTGRASTC